MFTIRGMAYGLTDVPEDLERKLRDYEIKINSLPKRDVRVCQNILHIFRLQNNNKDIPVIESLSDSTSESSHEVMDDTAFYQLTDNERLVQFGSHQFRNTAFTHLQFRTNNNNRTR